MCGRSSLHDAPVSVLERFRLPPALPGFEPRYNIAPTQLQWTIAFDHREEPAARTIRWGLIPWWSADAAMGNRMINARAESVAGKPSYRTSFQKRRCLVLADGYYEWMVAGRQRTPMFFHMSGHRPFVMAGLWDRWDKGEEPLDTCTIITTPASARTAQFHDRMPAVLPLHAAEAWMDVSTPERVLTRLLVPYEESDLDFYEVSRLVNNPANDSEECIQPAA